MFRMSSPFITFDVLDSHETPKGFALHVDIYECSSDFRQSYSNDSLFAARLRVYTGFAVIVMGPSQTTYMHRGAFKYDLFESTSDLVYCVLTGDVNGRMTLSCYNQPRGSGRGNPVFEEQFEVTNVWEGRWKVLSYENKGDNYGGWDVTCRELEMTNTQMKLKRDGEEDIVWTIRNPNESGFLAVNPRGREFAFDIRHRDFNHIGFHVSSVGRAYFTPMVEMTLLRAQ